MANKIPINWRVVEELLEAGCYGTEVASYLGIHEDTLYNRVKEEKGIPFTDYIYNFKRSYLPIPKPGFKEEKAKEDRKKKYKESKPKTPGVYLVRVFGTNYYKIGKTSISLKDRLGSMQTGCPMEIIPVKFKETNHFNKLEKYLHKESANNHVRGEWFEFTDLEVKDIVKKMEQYG